MTQPQAIIAATDFSESAHCAVLQAAQLSKELGTTLIIIYVFNDSVWSKIKVAYALEQRSVSDPLASARQKLNEICAQLTRTFNITVEAQVLVGVASQEIQKFVTSRQARLLVVGEHGEDWIRDAILGGTALKVLEATHIPVLLVRRPAANTYQRIIIATDFSESASRAAHLALDMFPHAAHHLIHAYAVPFEASMRMGGAQEEDIQRYREQEFTLATHNLALFTANCDHPAAKNIFNVALYGYPASVIFEQALGMTTDLIVMGKHGSGTFEDRLLGSVTQNILYHADCDVLLSP